MDAAALATQMDLWLRTQRRQREDAQQTEGMVAHHAVRICNILRLSR